MRETRLWVVLLIVLIAHGIRYQANAAPAAPLIKHLSSLIKWTAKSSSKSPQSDRNYLQFENGYLVETVVEGNEIGVVPHKIRLSDDGELYAVDEINSNVMKITPPLSQYSRGRLVAGSFQGKTGHVDSKPSEARFNHPRGLTIDDKGNVYVADTLNLAIRKIGDGGVTTIAGGKSGVAGYRDGPSEDAKFSNDFDVVYVRQTCSLLVIDRGNAALRQISLDEDDCDYQYSSVSPTDVVLVIGAVLIGYAACMLQQGFGPSFLSRSNQQSETDFKEDMNMEKASSLSDTVKDEPGWPSFGQLLIDLCKLGLEFLSGSFSRIVSIRSENAKPPPKKNNLNLTPLKDRLKMPEDEAETPLVQKQTTPAPLSHSRHAHIPKVNASFSEPKPQKVKSSCLKDPSLSSKHRSSSSKRQEYGDFYTSGEISRSKTQKERTRHRHREKTGEVDVIKSGEMKNPVSYDSSKFDHFSMRRKYGPDGSYGL